MSQIYFPRPFAIAIDDLGWIEAKNDGEDGYGPYRIGVKRKITLNDYKAVVDIAQRSGIRLQALFIMGEMDRENILGEFPTTTFMRSNWDNSHNISDFQIQALNYVKEQAAFMEFGLHGVGHEFWPEDGKRKRAEWYNTDDHHPWPEKEIRTHVDCFVRLMDQYGINQSNGHSFPESFVPCAYSYHWDPNGPYSSGSILSEYGVKYANTDFTQIPESNPPQGHNSAGFDHQVHVMNRYNYGNLWYALSKLPETPLKDQNTDFIETHWPNLLAQDDFLQEPTTEMWVDYFKSVQQSPDRYCSKNTAQHHAQWLYKKYCKVTENKTGKVTIDNREMPSSIINSDFHGNMVLKVKLEEGQHVSVMDLDGENVTAYHEDQGFGFLYLPPLKNRIYELTYEIGTSKPSNIIWHEDTNNIYSLHITEDSVSIKLRAYGTQSIYLICDQVPKSISSDNLNLKVLNWEKRNSGIKITIRAHDMQGETATLLLN